jgi:hypothetical protein
LYNILSLRIICISSKLKLLIISVYVPIDLTKQYYLRRTYGIFLCVIDAQPEDFVPYVEYKPNLQAYQWIGAGRDSDSHLQPLCQHWLDHRDEMTARPVKEEEVEEETGDGIGEERAASPPPPRCPTTWVVHPSTPEEKECFREQVLYQHSVFCAL